MYNGRLDFFIYCIKIIAVEKEKLIYGEFKIILLT